MREDRREGSSWLDVKPALDLLDEAFEYGGELLLLGMGRRFGGDVHRRPLRARVDEVNRAEVGVLDGPAVALDRGDSHPQRRGVTLPWHDDGGDVALAAGVFLDRAGHDPRGSRGNELYSHDPTRARCEIARSAALQGCPAAVDSL